MWDPSGRHEAIVKKICVLWLTSEDWVSTAKVTKKVTKKTRRTNTETSEHLRQLQL